MLVHNEVLFSSVLAVYNANSYGFTCGGFVRHVARLKVCIYATTENQLKPHQFATAVKGKAVELFGVEDIKDIDHCLLNLLPPGNPSQVDQNQRINYEGLRQLNLR